MIAFPFFDSAYIVDADGERGGPYIRVIFNYDANEYSRTDLPVRLVKRMLDGKLSEAAVRWQFEAPRYVSNNSDEKRPAFPAEDIDMAMSEIKKIARESLNG